jgi:hypothetical protein
MVFVCLFVSCVMVLAWVRVSVTFFLQTLLCASSPQTVLRGKAHLCKVTNQLAIIHWCPDALNFKFIPVQITFSSIVFHYY